MHSQGGKNVRKGSKRTRTTGWPTVAIQVNGNLDASALAHEIFTELKSLGLRTPGMILKVHAQLQGHTVQLLSIVVGRVSLHGVKADDVWQEALGDAGCARGRPNKAEIVKLDTIDAIGVSFRGYTVSCVGAGHYRANFAGALLFARVVMNLPRPEAVRLARFHEQYDLVIHMEEEGQDDSPNDD